ncbi:MAG: aldehyde dehydrogenase family protein, partial [Nocardioidaceae bacterium]
MSDLRVLRNFINGESVEPADGRTSEVVNPVNGKAYATAPVSRAEDVDRAIQAADKAFESWRDTTPSQRQSALLKLADAMEARADDIVEVESENTGKP